MVNYVNTEIEQEMIIGIPSQQNNLQKSPTVINENVHIEYCREIEIDNNSGKTLADLIFFKNTNNFIQKIIQDFFEDLPSNTLFTQTTLLNFVNEILNYISKPKFDFNKFIGDLGEVTYLKFLEENNIDDKFQTSPTCLTDFKFSEVKTIVNSCNQISISKKQLDYIFQPMNKSKLIVVKLTKNGGYKNIIQLIESIKNKNDYIIKLKEKYIFLYSNSDNKSSIDSFTINIENLSQYIFKVMRLPKIEIDPIELVSDYKINMIICEDNLTNKI